MKILIIIEYVINLILLSIFYMHMFQLNSYFFKKHMHWMKTNIKKIIFQILFVIVPTILLILKNYNFINNENIINLISILILIFSIIYNIPKKKAKVSFKITNRTKRMFITEFILICLIFMICNVKNYIFIKLGLINILSICLYIIANVINYPIEYLGRKRYINQAKKILQEMPELIVIGITGSYGKTSVKNYLAKILSAKYEVLTTPKNYNTTLGVVKTIRENLKPIHQIFICEMGATKVGDIKEICDIVKPKIGIITSIGPQHLESFKSIENIIQTKFELAESVRENDGVVFLNYENEYIKSKKMNMKYMTYGVNDANLSYNAYDLMSSANGLYFKIADKDSDREIEFKNKLIGKHNIINLMAAIGVSNYLGINFEKMVPRVKEIKSVEHRLEVISKGDFVIIDDSYNSNPVSAKSAIDTLGEFEGTKIIVTPGLIELGTDEKKYNFELGQYMTGVCDYIFLVGEEHSKSVLEGINSKEYDKNKLFIVNNPQEAIEKISEMNITGKITVLLENDLPDNYNL